MTVYRTVDQWVEGNYPSILAIGDSWFWYPNNNILESISNHPLMLPSYKNIQAVGYNGALLQQYVGAGKYAPFVEEYLKPANRGFFNIFMISGAGNDAVDYHLALRSNCSNIPDPKDCIDPDGIDNLLRIIVTAMGGLIHEIRWAYKDLPAQPRPIFINGYDYPVPDGRGFTLAGIQFNGPWLKPALDQSKVNPDLIYRIAVIKELIVRLNTTLASFNDWENDVVFVSSPGTLRTDDGYQEDWANELHPTPSGFNKIVNAHWIPHFKRWGMAN